MFTPEYSLLTQEWNTLQNNFEQYEKSALLVKLIAVFLCIISIAFAIDVVSAVILIVILWVQEGILRTFQSRLGERILRIESLISQKNPDNMTGCQLHSEWLNGRKGSAGLLVEYAVSTVRPTVAFPYAVLVVVILIRLF